MATIDDRVVRMRFDNNQFKSGISETVSLLDKFKGKFNFGESKKSVDDLQGTVGRFSFNPLTGGIETATKGFSAMSSIAMGALASIGSQAVQTGSQLVNSLTMKPVMDGFQEYELKMGTIQTILANTQRHGTTLDDVSTSLNALNEYADKTIYNFGDMTRNIGLFTNAGLELEESTSMIKGFSNAAAASGTSAQGASHAAYQLSQGLSAGYLTAMDWMSLTNAGMGNKNMQDDLIAIADSMGTFSEGSKTAEDATNDFKNSLAEGKWLTKDVMSTYLQAMAGDMDEAALKAIGLDDEVTKTLLQNAKTGEEAATKVRTFTQLIDTLQESVGSSWAETWELLFGDFDEASVLFTDMSEALEPIIAGFGDFRNAMLETWVAMGGQKNVVESVKNAFSFLMDILAPIGQAFNDVFAFGGNAMDAGAALAVTTKKIREFTENLKVSDSTAKLIGDTFKGIFSIFSIAGQIIGAVVKVLFNVITSGSGAAGSFLEITAAIGRFITSIDEALKEGTLLTSVIDFLSSALSGVIGVLSNVAGGISQFLSGGDGAAGVLQNIGNAAVTASEFIGNLIGRIRELLSDGFDKLGSLDWGKIFQGITAAGAVGLGAGLAHIIRKGITANIKTGLFDSLTEMFDSVKGTFDGVTDIFDNLTGVLETMQQSLKADILLKIAAAVGILALALVMLAGIPAEDLIKATTAIGTLGAQLLVAMQALTMITPSGMMNLQSLAGSMILIAGAVLILSVAVKSLSELSWGELVKGLVGVGVGIGILVGAVAAMPSGAKVFTSAAGMILMATALNIMASAVRKFGEMDIATMAKGIGGVAVTLGLLVLAMNKFPAEGKMVSIGVGLILVGAALKVVASAVSDFGSMGLGEIVQGMIGLASALLIIAGAMKLMPPNMVAIGAGLILVGAGISIISASIAIMGGLSPEQLATGLVALGGAITILSVGLHAMKKGSGGIVAMMGAAVALSLMAPAIAMLAQLDIAGVGVALAALAGTFVVLGLAAVVLGPLTPALLGLAGALTLISLAVLVAATGVSVFAGALAMLAGPAAAGIAVVGDLLALIPEMLTQLALGIVAFVTTLAASAGEIFGAVGTLIEQLLLTLLSVVITVAPQIGEALVAILTAVIDAIVEVGPLIISGITTLLADLLIAIQTLIPLFVDTFKEIVMALLEAIEEIGPQAIDTLVTLVQSMLDAIVEMVPSFVTAAIQLIVGVIDGISSQIGAVVESAVNLIMNFAEAISSQIPVVAERGAQMVIELVHGIADALRNNSGALGAAAADLGLAIVQGIASAIANGIATVTAAARDLANKALSAAKNALGIKSPSREFYKVGDFVVQGFASGMTKNTKKSNKAAKKMSDGVIKNTKKAFDPIDAAAEEKIPNLADSFSVTAKSIQDDSSDTGEGIQNGITKPLEYAIEKGEKGSSLNLKSWVGTINELTIMFETLDAVMEDVLGADARDRTQKEQDAITQEEERIRLAKESLSLEERSKNSAMAKEEERIRLAKEAISLEEQEISIREKKADLQKQLKEGKITPEELKREERKLQLERESLAIDREKYKIAKGQYDSNKSLKLEQEELALSKRKHKLDLEAYDEEYGEKQGFNLMAGLQKGIKGGWPGALGNMQKGGNNLINNFKKMFKIHSPSRLMQQFGENIVQGLANGLKDSAATTQMSKMFNDLTSEMDTYTNAYRELEVAFRGGDWGYASLAELIGEDSAKKAVNLAAATQMRDVFGELTSDMEIYKIAYRELEESFRGGDCGYGALSDILGEDSAKKAVDLAAAMGEELTGTQSRIRAIKSEYENILDDRPVIRPVIDLTDLRKGMEEINNMTNSGVGNSRRSAVGTLNRFSKSIRSPESIFEDSPAKSMVFNQYNNSPKALTVDDIYRKTNNQLEFIKGAFNP